MPDDNAPATRQDIAALRQEIKQDMLHMEDRLVEKMRHVQEEILRAFLEIAVPVELNLRALDRIEARLGRIEERVSRVERGELPPDAVSRQVELLVM